MTGWDLTNAPSLVYRIPADGPSRSARTRVSFHPPDTITANLARFWDPKYEKWGQGHMQARFSILQTMLSAGPFFVTLDSTGPDHDDLVINLNRDQIRSHGVPAVRAYLQKLHVFKTTADFAAGKKLYDDICTVGEDMAKYREVVMRKKLPRKQFVQANTVLKEGKVELVEYEATTEGIIKSFVERRV